VRISKDLAVETGNLVTSAEVSNTEVTIRVISDNEYVAGNQSPDDVVDVRPEDSALDPEVAFFARLATDLDQAASGLAFIYSTLDAVLERYTLKDVVAVVDEAPAGRQVFRVGRQSVPPDSWADSAVSRFAPGIHADPPALPAGSASYLQRLFSVALRLDLLRHDASHDPLTGLLNRRSYELLLNQAVSRSQRYGWPFALMVLDLNNFKAVNDRLGHAAGDSSLRAVGMELRQSLRSGDVAARIGGDEFALILANGGPELAEPMLRRLEAAVNAVVPSAAIGFSAGMASFPQEAGDVDALCRLADQRLYAAKP
jgi:diguanylate cyclase (GGDEF)-like protein